MTDDGRFLIDLSSQPAGERDPGGGRRQVTGHHRVPSSTPQQHAGRFLDWASPPPRTRTTRPCSRPARRPRMRPSQVPRSPTPPAATDATTGNAVVFHVLSGPAGLTIDPATGLVTWTPWAANCAGTNARRAAGVRQRMARPASSASCSPVDGRGARRRTSWRLPTERRTVPEGTPISFTVGVVDPGRLTRAGHRRPPAGRFVVQPLARAYSPGRRATRSAGTYPACRRSPSPTARST